jgi:hypothetical protein
MNTSKNNPANKHTKAHAAIEAQTETILINEENQQTMEQTIEQKHEEAANQLFDAAAAAVNGKPNEAEVKAANEAATANSIAKLADYVMSNDDKAEESKLKQSILDARKKVKETESTIEFASFEEMENNEALTAAETAVNEARKALNEFTAKQKEKKASFDVDQLVNAAKIDLLSKLGITNEVLEAVLLESKTNDKSTFKQSFVTVFGALPKNVAPNVTGANLSKAASSNNAESTANIPDGLTVNEHVKALMDAGNTHDQLNTLGHSDQRIRNVAYKIKYSKNANGTYAFNPKLK